MEDRCHKLNRALERNRFITKKRLHYERVKDQSRLVQKIHGGTKPHRFARAATKTGLARSLVNASADMVDVRGCSVKRTELRRPRKRLAPSVILFEDNLGSTGSAEACADLWVPDGLSTDEATADEDAQTCLDVEDEFGPDWQTLFQNIQHSPADVPEVAESIIRTLAANTAHDKNRVEGARALHELASRGREHAISVAQCCSGNAVKCLVELLGAGTGTATLQEMICKVLRAITICGGDYRASVIAAGGVSTVVDAMARHPDSVDIQLEGCRTLKEFAAHNALIQEEICAHSGVEVVLRAMERHTSVASMQELGCGVLRNMSAGQAKHQEHIASLGGIQLVCVAMALHQREAMVQWAGCWALFCLTMKNIPLRDRVVGNGGLGHVLRAMSEHRGVSRVQEAACWAVKVLAPVAEKNVAMTAKTAVSEALRAHPSDAQVQQAGQVALRSAGACPAVSRIPQRVTVAELEQFVKWSTNKRQCSRVNCLPSIPE